MSLVRGTVGYGMVRYGALQYGNHVTSKGIRYGEMRHERCQASRWDLESLVRYNNCSKNSEALLLITVAVGLVLDSAEVVVVYKCTTER